MVLSGSYRDLATLVKIVRTLGTSADYLLGLTDAVPADEHDRLMERLTVAASSLSEDQLATVVTQVEALAIPRPKKPGERS